MNTPFYDTATFTAITQGDPARVCAGCGTGIEAKAHRFFRFEYYCSKCYPRFFKPAACRNCGQPTRLPFSNQPATCRACRPSTLECTRCGKKVPKASRKFGNYVFCGSCANQARTKRPCDSCGKLGLHKWHTITDGTQAAICKNCDDSDFGSCSHCTFPAPLVAEGPNGKVCKSCAEHPGSSHACPRCDVTVPGAGQNHCDRCRQLNKWDDTRDYFCPSIEQPWCQELFLAFMARQALAEHLSNSLKYVNSYVAYFHLMDEAFTSAGEITFKSLLELSGPTDLTQVRTCYNFLIQHLNLDADNWKRAELREQRLIETTIRECCHPDKKALLTDYRDHLESKALKVLTIRQYIRAASKLLAAVKHPHLLTQKALQKHLKKNEGDRCSLSAFVRFLVAKNEYDLYIKTKSTTPAKSDEALAAALEAALKRLSLASSQPERQAHLVTAINIALGVPISSILQLRTKDAQIAEGGMTLTIEGVTCKLHDVFREKLTPFMQNNDGPNSFIFKGAMYGYSMSPSMVHYYQTKSSLNAF